jgi:dethiobiotin synthetase
MPDLAPLTIIVRGSHDVGKTTTASLIKLSLEENGYKTVTLKDVPPLASGEKADFFTERLPRTRQRPVNIRVELVGQPVDDRGPEAAVRAEAFFEAIDNRDLEKVKSVLSPEKFLRLVELAGLFVAKGA